MPGARVDTDAGDLPDVAASADAVLARLPSLTGMQRRLEPLPGGLTNRNYAVSTGTGARYVARFFGRGSALLEIDRTAEYPMRRPRRNSASALASSTTRRTTGCS